MISAKAVPSHLCEIIEKSGKSQREIARDAGFSSPNVLSMMKNGSTKVPLDKAARIALACDSDPKDFIIIAMREYHAEWWKHLEDHTGNYLLEDEEQILSAYRKKKATFGAHWQRLRDDCLENIHKTSA